jgi:zinc transport system permease protein
MFLEDFMVRALLAGIGVALVVGPLGCFVVWRRMSYFGDTLAHSALLGVVLGFLLSVDPTVGIVVTTASLAAAIVLLQEQKRWATDTLLGLLSHSALAVGLVAISLMTQVRIDLQAYLFGDILAVGPADLAWIWGGGLVVAGGLLAVWRPLLAITVHDELARAEGVPSFLVRLAFTLLLATVIAIAMKIVGILLITALLIIPAAAARRVSGSPEQMAAAAAAIGAVAVVGGLWGSLRLDTPSGPSIVVTALLLFVAIQVVAGLAGLARGAAGRRAS